MGRQQAFGGLVGQAVVNRQPAVSLGEVPKRKGPEMTLSPWYWWNRGESNPRPQAIAGRFYMRSCLNWI